MDLLSQKKKSAGAVDTTVIIPPESTKESPCRGYSKTLSKLAGKNWLDREPFPPPPSKPPPHAQWGGGLIRPQTTLLELLGQNGVRELQQAPYNFESLPRYPPNYLYLVLLF